MEPFEPHHYSRAPSGRQPPAAEPLALPDGARALLLHHRPVGPAARPVLMLHGIQSHPGWFVGSADAMAAAGHAVFQFQRRGSGTNPPPRGHARSPRQLLADLDTAVRHVREATGSDRLHLVGISWGGKYAACYALDPARAARLRSLTLVAPGFLPRVDVSLAKKIAIGVCAAVAPTARFAIPLNDPALFTDNPAMRQYLRDDPHRLMRATAGFLLTSRRMDRAIGRAPAGGLALPVHLLLARRDRIIHNTETKALLARLAGGSLQTVELDGAHTLEFEPDFTPLCRTVTEALASHE